MACRLFGAKPLPEIILPYSQLDPWEQTSVKFESKYKNFHWWNCTWKCCLRNDSHFVQGEIINWASYPQINLCWVQVLRAVPWWHSSMPRSMLKKMSSIKQIAPDMIVLHDKANLGHPLVIYMGRCSLIPKAMSVREHNIVIHEMHCLTFKYCSILSIQDP